MVTCVVMLPMMMRELSLQPKGTLVFRYGDAWFSSIPVKVTVWRAGSRVLCRLCGILSLGYMRLFANMISRFIFRGIGFVQTLLHFGYFRTKSARHYNIINSLLDYPVHRIVGVTGFCLRFKAPACVEFGSRAGAVP